ncbi:MAG: dimethyl sulfoxide reductase anchor subunit family protein [Hyphomicrobiales bacterium]
MHPAYSVIFFTTASGAGYGLLALLGLAGLQHGPASSPVFAVIAIVMALALITLGLLSSAFHLGRPERAWRAFSQWRSSWLSREGVVSVVTYGPALAFAAIWSGLIDAPQLVGPLGLITAVMCAATVFCTAKIYSTLTTIRAWSQPLTVPVYLAFALATGAALLAAIAALFARFHPFQAILAIVALALVALLKFLYWRSLDTAARTHTIEAATGLGAIGSVSQWEVAHTSENFIMKEMGYAVARKHALKLRKLVLLLLGLASLAMLAALALPVLAIPAALAALAAAAVERWLFFAEAQHVSTLYYGAKTA